MHFTKAFLAAAVHTLVNAAQITNSGFSDITAGTPFTITWSGATSSITLLLKNGPPTNLVTVSIIGSDLSGNSYSWTPSSSLVNDIYAIEIDAPGEDPNYSKMFPLNGGTSTSTSSPDPLLPIPEPSPAEDSPDPEYLAPSQGIVPPAENSLDPNSVAPSQEIVPPAENSPDPNYVAPPSYSSRDMAEVESRFGLWTNKFGKALPYDHYHVAAVPLKSKPNGVASGLAIEKVPEESGCRSTACGFIILFCPLWLLMPILCIVIIIAVIYGQNP